MNGYILRIHPRKIFRCKDVSSPNFELILSPLFGISLRSDCWLPMAPIFESETPVMATELQLPSMARNFNWRHCYRWWLSNRRTCYRRDIFATTCGVFELWWLPAAADFVWERMLWTMKITFNRKDLKLGKCRPLSVPFLFCTWQPSRLG